MEYRTVIAEARELAYRYAAAREVPTWGPQPCFPPPTWPQYREDQPAGETGEPETRYGAYSERMEEEEW